MSIRSSSATPVDTASIISGDSVDCKRQLLEDIEEDVKENHRTSSQASFARAPDGRLGKDISTPFNFKHEIHVDARFTGFPASWRYTGLPAAWAAALATEPSESAPPQSSRKLPSPLLYFKNISPSQRWNRVWTSWTIRFHPHPVEDENISYPFNFKHEVHADSKHTPSWHTALVLAASESWRTALSQRQGDTADKLPKRRLGRLRFSIPRPSWRKPPPRKPDDFGDDEGISLPRNFQHNIHVDVKYNGLPPSWANYLDNDFPPPYLQQNLASNPLSEPSSSYGPQVLKIRIAETSSSLYCTTIHVTKEMHFQEVLETVCRKRGVDPKSYALVTQRGDETFALPLDKTVSSFQDTEVVLIKRSRLLEYRPTRTVPTDRKMHTHCYVGDEGISWPLNFKHNIHVDENYNGLPPSWRAALIQQGVILGRQPLY